MVSETGVLSPTGVQYEIAAEGYTAVITESGAALRTLAYQGRDLINGFAEDAMPTSCRGQILTPWPNRIRDGRYSFGGEDQQLALTDPAHGNASHGLARWASWTVEEHAADSVSLTYRVFAQSGYPWTLDVHVRYALSAEGLHVTQSATNRAASPAPYASGAHPYLCVGDAIEDLELTLPARSRVLVDDRLLPIGTEPVAEPYDFTAPRRIGDLTLDTAFGDLDHRDQVATVTLRDPASSEGVALWVDEHHHWLQVFTPPSSGARPGIAVEPMTAPADAFNSGTDLITLAPAGEDGDSVAVSWGIRAL